MQNTEKQASRKYTPRFNTGGNFCGHSPDCPDLSLALAPVDSLPLFLSDAMKRFKRFYSEPELFPSLKYCGSDKRQMRSELREAVVKTVCAMLKFLDLASLRVGVPTPEGFQCLDIKYLCKHTGLSRSRLENAIAALTRAGILSSVQPRALRNDGQIIGCASIRVFSESFFGALGFAKRKIKSERDRSASITRYKANKHAKKSEKASNFSMWCKVKLSINAVLNKTPSLKQTKKVKVDDDYQLRWRAMVASLKQAHPTWSYDVIEREAHVQLLKQLAEV